MSNLKTQLKSTFVFISTVLAQHLIEKGLNHKAKIAEQLAQELRDQQLNVIEKNTESMHHLMSKVNNVTESLSNNNTDLPTNTISEELYNYISEKSDDTKNLGLVLKKLMKDNNLNDPEVSKELGENLSKILPNSKDVQKFIDEYFTSNSPSGEVKNFIGNSNINLESLSAYLDSLSLLQESALLNVCIFITILLTLINMCAALFANEILNYFDLEDKYPSISGFLKLRAKFQK